MKDYLRGFGIGVLFVTILFVLTKKPERLTDTEIQNRAEKMGMLTVQEAEEKRLGAIQESELKWQQKLEEQKNDYEALLLQKEEQDAKKEGETDQTGEAGQENTDNEKDKENESSGKEGESDESKEPGQENTDDENGKENGNLGEKEESNESEKSGQNEINSDTNDKTDKENENSEEGEESGETGKSEQNNTNSDAGENGNLEDAVPGVVKIQITSGMTAGQVSRLLEESGIVESATEFQQYLQSQKRQTLVQIGEYEFRQGESFKTIVDKITR